MLAVDADGRGCSLGGFPNRSPNASAASNYTYKLCLIRWIGSASRGGMAAPTISESPLQCMPLAVSCIAFKASSSVKVLGFWMGGKSLKVDAHCDAAACAP